MQIFVKTLTVSGAYPSERGEGGRGARGRLGVGGKQRDVEQLFPAIPSRSGHG